MKLRKKQHKYKHVHIYTFFKYVSRFMYLLIIPLIQHLLLQPESLIGFIGAMGFNILCVILLLSLSFSEYRSAKYHSTNEEFSFRKGCIMHRRAKIPREAIETVFVQRTFVSRLFGARKLHIDTPAVGNSSTDVNLYLNKKSTEALINTIYPREDKPSVHKSSNFRILIMAATWSNSFTGYLLFVPFINRVGDILGKEFSEMLLSKVNVSIYLASIGIPPLAATIGSIMLIGWVVSFLSQFFRYFGFKTEIYKDYIEINRGLINTDRNIVPIDKINVLQIKQSLIMIPMKLYGAFAYTISSGKTKGDKSMLIPAQPYDSIVGALDKMLPFNRDESDKVRPEKVEIISYLLIPFFIMLGLTAVLIIMLYFKIQHEIIVLYTLLSFIIVVILFILMTIAHKRSFLAANESCVVVSSYKGFSITKSIIPFSKIQCVVVRRSIFQRLGSDCTVKIYAYGEKSNCFIVRQLDHKKVVKLLNKLYK